MSIGQELLNVPFPKMVRDLAFAIAQGQLALDHSSLQTAKALAKAKVDIIPEFYEVINPKPRTVAGVQITGVDMTFEAADPVTMSLLQAGLTPTFYQFTESVIEVKISISTRTESKSELEAGVSTEVTASADFFFGSMSATVASHVNYKSSNTYSYSAEGSSLLRTTLKPVPPPARLMPRLVTINAMKTPVEVTITQ